MNVQVKLHLHMKDCARGLVLKQRKKWPIEPIAGTPDERKGRLRRRLMSPPPPRGGDSHIKRRGYSSEINRPLLKKIPQCYFSIFLRVQPNETMTAKNTDVLPKIPEQRSQSEIYTPKQDDEHPRPFHTDVPPRAMEPMNLTDKVRFKFGVLIFYITPVWFIFERFVLLF